MSVSETPGYGWFSAMNRIIVSWRIMAYHLTRTSSIIRRIKIPPFRGGLIRMIRARGFAGGVS